MFSWYWRFHIAISGGAASLSAFKMRVGRGEHEGRKEVTLTPSLYPRLPYFTVQQCSNTVLRQAEDVGTEIRG